MQEISSLFQSYHTFGNKKKKPSNQTADTVQQVIDTLGFKQKDFKSIMRKCYFHKPSLTHQEVYEIMGQAKEGKNPCAYFYWLVDKKRDKLK